MENSSFHKLNRGKVCGVCGNKILFGKRQTSKFLITDKILALINKFCNAEFNLNDERYPTSICSTCKVSLYSRKNGDFERHLPNMPNFKDIILLKETRVSIKKCNCYICRTGSSVGHKKIENGRGHKKLSEAINADNGLFAVKKEGTENTSNDVLRHKNTIKLCSNCFSEVSKGVSHICNSKQAYKNAFSTVKQLPDNQKDNLIGDLLRKKVRNQGFSKLNNVEVSLKSGGLPTRLVINPKPPKEVFFSVDKLDSYLINAGLSLQKMEKFTNFLRCTAGENSVPAYYRNHASKMSKSLENIYKCDHIEFDVEKSEDKQFRPVVWADAEELLDAVLDARQETGPVQIKVMADGGQGSFKISMSIRPENCEDEEDEEDCTEPQNKKRRSYEDGGTMGRDSNLNGVKKLIIICAVYGMKETYYNLHLLFQLTKLNRIPFKFSADFKVILIAIGQQTASASYPCPFCYVTLSLMKSGDCGSVLEEEESDLSVGENCLKLKTFGDLRESYKNFNESGGNKKMAKNYQSTINLPLFDEDDKMHVIEKVVIPELHELQGLVNYMFWNGLVPLLGEENALKFPQKLNLISKDYHGDTFEGNQCRVMLKEADKLVDKDVLGKVSKLQVIPYVETFKSMDKLVHACFTTKKIDDNFNVYLNELRKNYFATNLPVTLKVHVLLEHLSNGLHFLGGFGLGLYSEQAGESIHHEFLEFWERYKVNDIKSEKFLSQFKKAVVEFSSRHV